MTCSKLITKVLCTIIAAASLCSCNKKFSDTQFNKIYDVNSDGEIVFVGNINNKEYAAFITKYSSTNLVGYSFLLNGCDNDTIAFSISRDGKNLIFKQNGIADKFRIKKIAVSGNDVRGRLRRGFFEKTEFKFSRYHIPEYKTNVLERYAESLFEVDTIKNVKYGEADGYWTESAYDIDAYKILKGQGKTLINQRLDLKMDIYLPHSDTLEKRPLVMLIHGGAFYVGNKEDIPIKKWCSHYASLGYVSVSIDYRMGFRPAKRSIERAVYSAIQDAHAAMRFLVDNQSVYGIDTSMIFIGGTSAGAITALHLAFMNNQTRPGSSYARIFSDDMGQIESSGNNISADFTIKGVVDMWGAISDINMIDSQQIPVIAFHGDYDDIVPFGYDYPFKKIGSLNKFLFDKMYGSYDIVNRLKTNGVTNSQLYTLHNMGHSPHIDSEREVNDVFYYIQDNLDPFFHDITVSNEILRDGNVYKLKDNNSMGVSWHAEGGFILENSDNEVRIAWFTNAPSHTIKSSGLIRGAGFTCELNIK
ncbi:MAG: alpha/beta hydrolase [Candidatus Limimorpha sp.]